METPSRFTRENRQSSERGTRGHGGGSDLPQRHSAAEPQPKVRPRRRARARARTGREIAKQCGAANFVQQQRAKFFDDARGSAIECAVCLDASVAKGFVVLQRIEFGKAMSIRIVAMLTKLLERFDPEQFRVRESPSDPAVPLEHDL